MESGIDKEFASLDKNQTWEIVSVPVDKRCLNSKWVFRTKKLASGELLYKARLVVKGCSQKKGIDFTDTYSPVIRYNSLRYLLALAAKHDFQIDQLDAVTALLQEELHEEIYISCPKGLKLPQNKVLKLKKLLIKETGI